MKGGRGQLASWRVSRRTVRPMLPRRGFSIMEIAVAMMLLAILSGIGVATYNVVQQNMDRAASMPTLGLVQLQARKVLANTGVSAYPGDIASLIAVPQVTITTGASSSPTTVSVFRFDENTLVLAAGSAGGCTMIVDRLNDSAAYLVDRSVTSCLAQTVAGSVVGRAGGTPKEPIEVVL